MAKGVVFIFVSGWCIYIYINLWCLPAVKLVLRYIISQRKPSLTRSDFDSSRVCLDASSYVADP